ncbi:hypothetical protein L1987_55171 [Smallanthus sonchifolius]|uniref:Uncharacterized protein n=1 Tax=Smallanthus sonchifolius TaxID=185202 RepID=A0ACB9E8Z0_9ASTR|nr:hypothetical protein L1987_55171 [Smallanthus sonchifolius]
MLRGQFSEEKFVGIDCPGGEESALREGTDDVMGTPIKPTLIPVTVNGSNMAENIPCTFNKCQEESSRSKGEAPPAANTGSDPFGLHELIFKLGAILRKKERPSFDNHMGGGGYTKQWENSKAGEEEIFFDEEQVAATEPPAMADQETGRANGPIDGEGVHPLTTLEVDLNHSPSVSDSRGGDARGENPNGKSIDLEIQNTIETKVVVDALVVTEDKDVVDDKVATE